MNIVIRVDASTVMGSGHVMRTLTLADACRRRGAAVRFICRRHPGNLVDLIRGKGFPVTSLPGETAEPRATSGYANWLGASPERDAGETVEAVNGLQNDVDWLVVDHYGADATWETRLRGHVQRILVIDDLADRRHDCDLLLDQNYRPKHDGRYEGLVPAHCRLAMGPHYALLQEDYSQWRPRVAPRSRTERVFVYFGGTDPAGLTGMAAKAALSLGLTVEAVVSTQDRNLNELELLASSTPRLRLSKALPSLASLMASCDLGIGAFGATSWERLCLGLPCIAVTVADNQKDVARALVDAGLAVSAGCADTASEQRFREAIREIMHAPHLREWSERCAAICDGLGASRVAGLLGTGAADETSTRGTPMDKFDPTVQRNGLGFWEIANKPDDEAIRRYYASRYYQEAKGSYEHTYSADELNYFKSKLEQRWSVLSDRVSSPGSMLDVGCGEGFALSFFRGLGWQARGLDFSRAGIETQNPDCLDNFVEGNLFETLRQEISTGNKYDVIWVQNVLEHVPDPVSLMNSLRSLVNRDGVLVVTVPNDFSRVQLEAQRRGLIDRDFWVAVPDHLSYFSRESLEKVGAATGWSAFEILGDFPIDWFLFHSGANYVMTPSAGKPAHMARVVLENLIHRSPLEDVTNFYSALAKIGMGRDLTAFFECQT